MPLIFPPHLPHKAALHPPSQAATDHSALTIAGSSPGGLRAQTIARLAVVIVLIAPVPVVVWAARKPTTFAVPFSNSPSLGSNS